MDGHGSFTLDPLQALEKLRRYQLENPNAYLLKWVQAGVARGASCLRVQVSAGQVSVTYEGIGFRGSELANLFPSLLGSEVDPAVKALAIGVNSALASGPHRIVLESWDGERGFEHSWRKSGPLQRPFHSKSGPFSRLRLERKLAQTGRNWWSALAMPLEGLFGKQASLGPEAALLSDSHCLVPAPLYLNGALCRRPFGPNHRLEVYYANPQGSLRCPAETDAAQLQGYQAGQPVDCVIALTADPQQPGRLWMVESGVILGSHNLPGRGATVLACARNFDKDLSDFKVVQNQRFYDFMGLIQERLATLF